MVAGCLLKYHTRVLLSFVELQLSLVFSRIVTAARPDTVFVQPPLFHNPLVLAAVLHKWQ
jgi:hypothetical protein